MQRGAGVWGWGAHSLAFWPGGHKGVPSSCHERSGFCKPGRCSHPALSGLCFSMPLPALAPTEMAGKTPGHGERGAGVPGGKRFL